MNEWQTIDTAPKDGRWVLVVDRVRIVGDGITIARYDADLDINEWYSGVDMSSGFDDPLQPTHWMPLPSPPTDEATSIDARLTDSNPGTAIGSATQSSSSLPVLVGAERR